ncbi:leucine-rich PPR motif-containing protein, mitochondrial-like [Ptychodera flava]|uniref:leucine-rich PPR motif-containing protein, mitochondrial-like n=1 Tax=Ptychodera flava TaxID=63121 RepID=UPI00396A5C0E
MATLLRSARNARLLRFLAVPIQRSGRSGRVVTNVRRNCRLSLDAARPTAACSCRYLSTETDLASEDVSRRQPVQQTKSQQRQTYEKTLNELDETVKRMGRITKTKVTKTFEDLCNSGAVTSNLALLLIRCCGTLMAEVPAEERTEIVHKIWEKLPHLGIEFDSSHYNALLKIYIENEHQFAPTEFIANMESKGVTPNRVTHQRLIAAYCLQGDIQGAGKVLEFMKNKEMPITDSVFNSLITGHARAGDMENATKMLTIMKNVGLQPTIDTYTSLMGAHAETGDIDSVREVLHNLRQDGKDIPDKNLMILIQSLAKSGQKEFTEEIIGQLRVGPRYIPDAINLCLTLVTQGHDDTAFELLKTFQKMREQVEPVLAVGEEFNQGSFFVDHIVKLNRPTDNIKNYLQEMQSLNIHSFPYFVALQSALEDNNQEYAYEFMKIIKEQGRPLRPHYFWPLMVQHWQNGNAEGMKEIIRAVLDHDVEIDIDTFMMYIFPTIGGEAESLLEQLQEIGVPESNSLIGSLFRWEVAHNRLEKIPKLVKHFGTEKTDFSQFRVSLIQAFFRDTPVDPVVNVLKLIDNGTISVGTNSTGITMLQMVDEVRTASGRNVGPKFQELFEKVHRQGIKITASHFRQIRSMLDQRGLGHLKGPLRKLINLSELNDQMDANIDLLPIQSVDPDKLESHYEELKKKNMNTRGALRRLIMVHAFKGQYDKAMKFKDELLSSGHEATGAIYAMLIDMTARLNRVEEAMQLKQELESFSPDFPLDSAKYIKLAQALTLHGRLQDALDMLQDMKDRSVPLSELTDTNVFHMLNNVALAGQVEESRSLFQKCIDLEIIQPTPNVTSPLVTGYFQRGDLKGALDCVIECHDKYKLLPRFHDLLVKLVEAGNKEELQRAMDFGSQAVGEMNILYDLVFAFLSAGKYKQAKKIVETPGFRGRTQRLNWYSKKCLDEGQTERLETLVDITQDLFGCDRDQMYMFLLRLYAKNDNWQKCLDAYARMQEEQLVPRDRTLRYLADVLKTHGQEVPFKVPERTVNQETDNVEDTTIKYQRLIMNVGRAGNYTEARRLFDEALSKGCELSSECHTVLLRTALQADNLSDALSLKELCEQKSIAIDAGIEAGFIFTGIRTGNIHESEAVFNKVIEDGRVPNKMAVRKLVTYYEEQGEPETILNIMEKYQALASEVFPFYKHILGAYLTRNEPDAALDLIEEKLRSANESATAVGTRSFFHKMMEKNLPLDRVYSIVDKSISEGITRQGVDLLHALIDVGNTQKAKELYQKYPSLSENPGNIVRYAIQESKAGSEQDPQRLINLASIITDPEIKEKIYFYLMKLYENNSDWQSALELRQKCLDEGVLVSELTLKRLAMMLKRNNQALPFEEPPETMEYYRNMARQQRKDSSVLELKQEEKSDSSSDSSDSDSDKENTKEQSS